MSSLNTQPGLTLPDEPEQDSLVSPSLAEDIKKLEAYLHGVKDFPVEDRFPETTTIPDIPPADSGTVTASRIETRAQVEKTVLPPPTQDKDTWIDIPPPPLMPDLKKKLKNEPGMRQSGRRLPKPRR